MTKIISPYPLCHATSIINRSANIGDEVENGDGDVEITNITTSKIRNGMAGDSNAVYDLYSHENVNRWSHFGPYEHNIVSYVVTPQLKSPAKMGDFAGYDHNAVEPYIELAQGTTTEKSYWKGESTCADDPDIIIGMHLAEIDFKALSGGSGKLLAEMIDDNDSNNKFSFTISDYENDSTFMTMTTQRDVNSVQGFAGSPDAGDYTITLKSLTSTDVFRAYVGDSLSVAITEAIYTPAICVPNDSNCDHPSPDDPSTDRFLTLDTKDNNVDTHYFRRRCPDGPNTFYVAYTEVVVRDHYGQPDTSYNNTVSYSVKWWPTDEDEQNETNVVFEQVFSLSITNGYWDEPNGNIITKAFENIDLDQRNRVVVFWDIP